MSELRAARVNRGLSLDQLSDETGVPKTTLARVERGSVPNPSTQKKIADFYDVQPTDLWPIEMAA